MGNIICVTYKTCFPKYEKSVLTLKIIETFENGEVKPIEARSTVNE